MSYRQTSYRGRRGGTSKRSRGNGESRGRWESNRDDSSKSQPAAIARSPERPPVAVNNNNQVSDHVDWTVEDETPCGADIFSDPSMPSDLVGVIGYCSDKSIGELPGTLVLPSDIHKSVQDAKNYLFGSELENAMRKSLEDYTKVSLLFLYCMKVI